VVRIIAEEPKRSEYTNGLNMYHYLWYLLEELPETDLSEKSFANYLPWNQEVKQDLEEWVFIVK